MIAIRTEKLTKYYKRGHTLGVKDLNLEIKEGEIFGYIGPNGAGKTTTIRLLLDLIRPTRGHAEIFGLDVHQHSTEIKESIGFLPGEIFLPEQMTGKESIHYYGGFKKSVDNDFLKKMIKKLDFDLNKKVSNYSKGNRQKLAIILALMHKPKLLILDEPTSGLDPLNQNTFYDLIKEVAKENTTVFISTHILAEAQNLCDRVAIIKDGHVLKIENIDDFRKKNIREIHLFSKDKIKISDLKSPGVEKIESTEYGFHLITTGENGKILKNLSKFNIDDIKIYEPSLEEIFMHFYK